MSYIASTRLLKIAVVVICLFAWSSSPVLADVVFDWAVVGNPGNAPDREYAHNNPNNLRFGGVNYNYRISKHEVTNAQYAEFLNRVAASDPNNLFNPLMDITRSGSNGSYTYLVNATFESNPVNWVSFFDAMRFTNWLHNGQGAAGTESGVYNIGDGVNETRATDARYFIPREDEWYKAAYYDPRVANQGGPPGDDNYWFFPTQHDNAPIAEAPSGGANSANFRDAVNDTTDVGAYTGTTGFYGTFDQGGNVWEWNEAVIDFSSRSARGRRGGSYGSQSSRDLGASHRPASDPAFESFAIGFRVASSIPEPSVVLPDSYLVTRGTTVSGGVPELAESDDQYLVLDPEFLTFRYQLEFTVEATSPSELPSGLEFNYESRAFSFVGTVDQEIELFNYDSGQFETVDTRLASATDTVVSVTPGGDPARFVEAGTNAIQARIRYQNSLPFWVFSTQNLYLPYRVRADHIFWTITP